MTRTLESLVNVDTSRLLINRNRINIDSKIGGKTNEKKLEQEKGITLIALVITIIVLLILAGVSIAMLTGENGILSQAQNAKNKTEEAEEIEKIQLSANEAQLGNSGYQELTEENLQKEIDEQFGSGSVKVYANEKNAFSFIFQNEETNYRLEKDGSLNKIDIALKINNVDDFRSFMNEVNSGNTFENQYVYLLENIDLTNETWDVIGSYTDDTNNKAFAGIFEGNNRTINGLNISKSQDYVGLFAYNTGTIRDIVLESGSITGQGRVAGITAVNAGTIENCHNKGVIINASGVGVGGIVARSIGEITYCSNSVDIASQTVSYIGGIVGALNYTKMTNCYNTGNIEAVSNTGGLIGGNTGSNVECCYNTGNVKGTGKNEAGGTYVGGIAGNNRSNGKIIACYNVGSVRSEYVNGGGITGQLVNGAEVKNCYNIGIVENQGSSIGNISGSVYSSSKISNCYFSKGICDLEGVGRTNDTTTIEVIDETISYMKTSSFVNDLNKDEEVFVISGSLNNGYPVLKWQVE